MSKQSTISQIIGVLVKEGLSTKEVIEVLNKTKEVYLDRSYHINTVKKAD